MIMLINIVGLSLIGFIIWWFWLSSPASFRAENQVIDILVENGTYSPANIQARKDTPLTLRFVRKDPSPCAEKVQFSDLDISADLPVNTPVELSVPTDRRGEYEFTCQMRMYRGKLTIN